MGDIQLIGYIGLLASHHVDYLIVGGVGSRIQGAATTTQDLDIMPEPSPENLERLARALTSPTTRFKAADSTTYEPVSVVDSILFKTSDTNSFETDYGVLDVLMELPGVGTFDAVRRNAKRYEFDGQVLVVANLDDIVKSKETTGRSKDWRAMDALREAQDRLRAKSDSFELQSHQLDVGHPLDD
jgi:hypothetical protein